VVCLAVAPWCPGAGRDAVWGAQRARSAHGGPTGEAGRACGRRAGVGVPRPKLHSASAHPCQAASVRAQSNQMLSGVLRAGRVSTAGRSPLSTPDSILMCYQKSSKGQRRGVAQHRDASAANRYLRIRMAGLCYDKQPVEAMPLA
jgi:hypothetical protein